MEVHLIHSTPHAKRILSFAKDTRLLGGTNDNSNAFTPLQRMMTADKRDVDKNVKYSMNTIRGPLEFIHFIFLFMNASRAMTHQLVRHRVASFAQQSLRVSDNFGYYQPPGIDKNEEARELYQLHVLNSTDVYGKLVEMGIDLQDARGVLPLHATSAIMMKVNLRALLEMFETRLCLRVQGEHRGAMVQMKRLTSLEHPWLSDHIGPLCAMKGVCAFPRYDCPISNAFPELKGLPEDTLFKVNKMVEGFGDKGLAPKAQK
jgi:thymidylate synthase (FAD)